MATKIFTGQTVRGTVNLRITDQTTSAQKPYVLPSGYSILLKFPGASGTSVILSTANSGEITVIDANAAQLSYVMSPAKSALLLIGNNAAVDCEVHYNNTALDVDIFEAVKIYNIAAQANP